MGVKVRIAGGSDIVVQCAYAVDGGVSVGLMDVYEVAGAVGGCAIREGTLLYEIAGKSSCEGATGQVSRDVDLSVLIRL